MRLYVPLYEVLDLLTRASLGTRGARVPAEKCQFGDFTLHRTVRRSRFLPAAIVVVSCRLHTLSVSYYIVQDYSTLSPTETCFYQPSAPIAQDAA